MFVHLVLKTEYTEFCFIYYIGGGPNLQLRLTGGNNRYEGRLEVQVYGRWGTICDDSFGTGSARVACRMLGYQGYVYFIYLKPFWLFPNVFLCP